MVHYTQISMHVSPELLKKEFNRQVNILLELDYPTLAGITRDEFLQLLDPLKNKVTQLEVSDLDIENGKIPFVIVVKNELVPSEKSMSLVSKDGIHGVTILRPHTSQNFMTVESITLPDTAVYVLVDIDRGKKTINVPPNEALKQIESDNRSPLTIDEGIALVTHYPDFLIKNNCFSLLASRTGKDQRVPAIWINGKKEPNLGWCWDGNPHTWLGSASCGKRI